MFVQALAVRIVGIAALLMIIVSALKLLVTAFLTGGNDSVQFASCICYESCCQNIISHLPL